MTKRFTVMAHAGETMCVRITLNDMRLLELGSGPFQSIYNPVMFVNTAAAMAHRFIKTDTLKPRYANEEEALAFVKEFVSAGGNTIEGLSKLYTIIQMALIDSGWVANPFEEGDIGTAAKPTEEPKEVKYFHQVVGDNMEPYLLGFGLQFDEIDRLTPAEAKALIDARFKVRTEELRNFDVLNSGVIEAIIKCSGRDCEREKLMSFGYKDIEVEYVTYKDAETNEEQAEQILECNRMANVMKGMCKPKV